MNKYKKLASNTVILGIGTFGSKLLVFLLMPLYTAWLTTAEYGAAEMISGIANFLIPIACVGVSTGIFRFAAEREADQTKVFSSSVALLGLGLGGFLLLSPLLFLIPYCRPYVWLVVLYVFFADLQAVCAQYLRAIDRTTLFAGQGILNTALTILCNVLFLFVLKMGVEGYILSVIVGNLLTTVFIVWRAKLWKVFSFGNIDRRLMKEKGVAVVHNPSSNMKLGSGFAPIPQMLDEGILVSLGTDGAASNNTLNMVKELHLASIIHNGYHGDAALMTAKESITMATRSGALVQVREDTGELTAGKKADIIAVALDRPHLTPHIDTEGLVAYSMQGSDVVLTMVDGRILYENGEYLTLDKEKIIYEANAAAKRLQG